MTQSPNLQFTLVDPNQLQKSVTANTALEALEAALSTTLTVAANSNPSPYTIPYSSTDGGVKTAVQFLRLLLTGALSGAWTGYVPALPHLFLVDNSTTGGFATTIMVSGQTGVAVPAGIKALVYNDGTDVKLIGTFSTGGGASILSTDLSVTVVGGTTTLNVQPSPTTAALYAYAQSEFGGL